MVTLPDARPPEGMRIYAIGDVHGRLDLLEAAHERIARDLRDRPAADWRLVHVGDYVDRGPHSREVIGLLAARAAEPEVISLRGNHDQYLIDFLDDPDWTGFDHWMRWGGLDTLASWGIELGWDASVSPARRREIRATLRDAIPAGDRAFLDDLPVIAILGDFVFVHAGIRPGLPVADQDPSDLIWIREPFLSHEGDLGAVVVHGHTPVDRVEVRPHRIGIDTGAVYGGPLTCLVLEGASRARLTAGRLDPLD